MKVVSIAILRTGPDVAEPVPVSMACELSSYGFFQRQVRQAGHCHEPTRTEVKKPWFLVVGIFLLFPPSLPFTNLVFITPLMEYCLFCLESH